MTGAEVMAEVLANFHLASTDTIYDAQGLTQINRALSIISAKGFNTAIEQTVALTSATRRYTLAAGTVKVTDAYIDGRSYGLVRIAEEDIYRYSELALTGEPWGYWEETTGADSKIVVHPMPNGDYKLNVRSTGPLTPLTALTDTVDAPDAYVIAIPEFVTWRIAATEKDYAHLVATYSANWSGLLDQAVEQDKAKNRRKFGGNYNLGLNPLAAAQYVRVRR